ncbi:HNH endonuclease [Cupriavidus phytorum]|uniref:HNH endonuclease n=1 Tax=Cupriavidus phytorum TaxID=3024399 RepID=UPI000E2FBF80|nr:HNH endonuclease [Cupriavidus taiwanensis]
MYIVGSTYSRNDIYTLLSLPEAERGGDWLNGYHRHGSDYYIFCNIGVPGRTGHDYDNHWDGEKLIWHGKGQSHFAQQAIRNLLSGDYRVFVFYRSGDRDPFTFAGVGQPIPHSSIERPVRIDWAFGADDVGQVPVFTDEFVPGAEFEEGQRTQVFVNRYERDRGARDACIRHYGASCAACGINFGSSYGELGEGFIHVHHVVPVSEIGQTYVVDPVKDLVPVCPNCHAMLHRQNPPLTIEELKGMRRI